MSGSVDTLAQVDRDTWLAVIPHRWPKTSPGGELPSPFPRCFLNPRSPSNVRAWWRTTISFFPTAGSTDARLCEDYPLHSLEIRDVRLVETAKINEDRTCFP